MLVRHLRLSLAGADLTGGRRFDGEPHQLVYAFREGGEQRLFIDGTLVNDSKFDPVETVHLTGFAISEIEKVRVIDSEGFSVSVDQAVDEAVIDEMLEPFVQKEE